MKDRVTNTAKQMQEDRLAQLAFLVEGMGPEGPSAAILRQEARGMAEVVATQNLPTNCQQDEALRSFGVELGEPFPDDKIFRPAKLPTGWKIEPTDHDMNSYLVDEKGRKRASIFYKAAWYDRSASMQVLRRYNVEYDYVDANGNKIDHFLRTAVCDYSRCTVKDAGTVLFATDKLLNLTNESTDLERKTYYDRWGALQDDAKAWLLEHYPQADDVTAYWDEP